MSIISKIEALKLDYDFPNDYTEGFNRGINRVLDVLKAEFEEKDQPDEEGWWWNIEEKQFVRVTKGVHSWWYENMEKSLPVSYSRGKWVKAIVPE